MQWRKLGKFPTRSKLFIREIPTADFASVRHRYASTLSCNHYLKFYFKFFHVPPQQQGLFEPLLRTCRQNTVPTHVDGPTRGGPHLLSCVHVGTGENTSYVDRKFTFLNIFSLLDGGLMKNIVLPSRLCTMVIKWREWENESVDNEALNDLDMVNMLRHCGLLKYF